MTCWVGADPDVSVEETWFPAENGGRVAHLVPTLPLWIRVGAADTIGLRSMMEDAICITSGQVKGLEYVLFCVFDGHAHFAAARRGAEYLPCAFAETLTEEWDVTSDQVAQCLGKALLVVEERMREEMQGQPFPEGMCGTTAVCSVVVHSDDQYYISTAHLGDSRAVLATQDTIQSLTKDHKVWDETEAQSIKKAGGFVSPNGRVNGSLAMTRSLGDWYLKGVISSQPTLGGPFICRNGVLLLCCDGVWDVMSDVHAVNVVKEVASEKEAALQLRDIAFQRGSDDNITVIVARFGE